MLSEPIWQPVPLNPKGILSAVVLDHCSSHVLANVEGFIERETTHHRRNMSGYRTVNGELLMMSGLPACRKLLLGGSGQQSSRRPQINQYRVTQ